MNRKDEPLEQFERHGISWEEARMHLFDVITRQTQEINALKDKLTAFHLKAAFVAGVVSGAINGLPHLLHLLQHISTTP